MTNKYTEDDYCDLFSKKICDNCGKCLEEDGIDIRAINIDDIAKNVEENAFIEEELKNALEALKEEESDLKEDLSEELTLDNYNDILDKLDSDEEYVDAFDNIVYFHELGVENYTGRINRGNISWNKKNEKIENIKIERNLKFY